MLSTDQTEGKTVSIADFRGAISDGLVWIDAVPREAVPSVMPGFDRDWVEGLLRDDPEGPGHDELVRELGEAVLAILEWIDAVPLEVVPRGMPALDFRRAVSLIPWDLARGAEVTPTAARVLEVLYWSDEPLTQEAISSSVRVRGGVGRTLDTLIRMGLIRQRPAFDFELTLGGLLASRVPVD